MIILGCTLVVLGLLLEVQALWVFGATLIAAGAVLALVGTTGQRFRRRSSRATT